MNTNIEIFLFVIIGIVLIVNSTGIVYLLVSSVHLQTSYSIEVKSIKSTQENILEQVKANAERQNQIMREIDEIKNDVWNLRFNKSEK